MILKCFFAVKQFFFQLGIEKESCWSKSIH